MKWTDKDIKVLEKWAKSGSLDRDTICKKLGRRWHPINCKINLLGLDTPQNKKDAYVQKEMDKTKDEEIQRLHKQIKELNRHKNIVAHKFFDKVVRIGVVTDTHMGSMYHRKDVLDAAYDTFEREGIKQVYHAGDLCDGEKVYRGQEYEIFAHGADAQVKEVVKNYPKKKGIMTYFITGNHDLSFYVTAGTDIGDRIAAKRPDMVYLGKDIADVIIGDKKNAVRMRLVHPGGGSAYALSYAPQKYIEALAGGQKPEIIIFGHYHKAEMLPCYRNTFAIQGGTCQSQTPFMTRRKLAAHLGFWILEFTIDKPYLISRFKSEFFAVYEERDALQI